MCVPWESNPQPFVLLTQCSTTEPHRNTKLNKTKFNFLLNIHAEQCLFYSGTRPIWRSNRSRCWGSALVWFLTLIITSPPETPTSVLWASRLWVRLLHSPSPNTHSYSLTDTHTFTLAFKTFDTHHILYVCGHQTSPACVVPLLWGCVCWRPFPASVSECH